MFGRAETGPIASTGRSTVAISPRTDRTFPPSASTPERLPSNRTLVFTRAAPGDGFRVPRFFSRPEGPLFAMRASTGSILVVAGKPRAGLDKRRKRTIPAAFKARRGRPSKNLAMFFSDHDTNLLI